MICVREGQTPSLAPCSSKLSSEAIHTERELPCRKCARPLGSSSGARAEWQMTWQDLTRNPLVMDGTTTAKTTGKAREGNFAAWTRQRHEGQIMDVVNELEAHTDHAGRNPDAQPEIRAAQDTQHSLLGMGCVMLLISRAAYC